MSISLSGAIGNTRAVPDRVFLDLKELTFHDKRTPMTKALYGDMQPEFKMGLLFLGWSL